MLAGGALSDLSALVVLGGAVVWPTAGRPSPLSSASIVITGALVGFVASRLAARVSTPGFGPNTDWVRGAYSRRAVSLVVGGWGGEGFRAFA